MSNVHGLRDDKSDDEKDHENDRYVGGIGERGGGRWADIDDGSACFLRESWCLLCLYYVWSHDFSTYLALTIAIELVRTWLVVLP